MNGLGVSQSGVSQPGLLLFCVEGKVRCAPGKRELCVEALARATDVVETGKDWESWMGMHQATTAAQFSTGPFSVGCLVYPKCCNTAKSNHRQRIREKSGCCGAAGAADAALKASAAGAAGCGRCGMRVLRAMRASRATLQCTRVFGIGTTKTQRTRN